MFGLFIAGGKFFGLGEKSSKVIGSLLVIAAIGFLVWKVLDNMTDAAYAKGQADEKAVWVAAEDAFKQKAQTAATEADRNQAKRDAAHAEAVSKEREKISEAVAQGLSPIDVLFPSSVR